MAKPSPVATNTSPITEIAVGTVDQPKRWSRTLTTIIAASDMKEKTITTFCTGLVSALGPACMRRSSAAGFVRIK